MSEHIAMSIVKNKLLAIPGLRGLSERRRGGYVPWKNSDHYIRDVFKNASERVASRPSRGSVLEIGPGGNLGPMLLFLNAGFERGVCLDVTRLLSDQTELYQSMIPNADVLLKRIEYRCPEAIEDTSLPDESFDLIYSAACFEHVLDPMATLQSVYRLLKPGGVTTHSIDLRDHRDFENPLGFLRYPDWAWTAASSRRLAGNRWRASDWTEGFYKAGFETVDVEPHETVEVSDGERAEMHRDFRAKSLADLGVTVINVTASKPLAPSLQ
jgi:SAM-dependent methyltransferase